MRAFLQYLVCFIMMIAASYMFVPRYYGVVYPKPAGPIFHPAFRTIYQQDIDKRRPDIVLLGDSLAASNVDPNLLSNMLDKTVYDISISGSPSALWYLVIKNNILLAKHKPAYLIIVFRDTMLTTPDYRVQGSYFDQINEFANSNDQLLIQLAFVNKMNWLEKLADQYLPPYGSSMNFRASIDATLRDVAPRLFMHCNSSCVGGALANVFQENRFLSKVMGDAIDSAGDYLYTPENLNFQNQVNQSFLPEIVSMCKENNIQLVLVRSKTRDFTHELPNAGPLSIYMSQLAAYSKQNNIILLDFMSDSRITPDFYTDSLHFNRAGKEKFTTFLVSALAPYIH